VRLGIISVVNNCEEYGLLRGDVQFYKSVTVFRRKLAPPVSGPNALFLLQLILMMAHDLKEKCVTQFINAQ
jgi:hypothetical protein